MAGKMQHLLKRDGRYYARVTVSVALRQYVGKREMTAALGSDREEAIRTLPGGVARFQDQLAEARRQAARDGTQSPEAPRRPLSIAEIAQAHYADLLLSDDELRNLDYRYAAFGFHDEDPIGALKSAAAGAASDNELNALIGHVIRVLQKRGNVSATIGTPEWRELADYRER